MACAVGAAPSNGTLRVIAGARTPPPAPTECTVTWPLVLAVAPLTRQAHARHCSTARLVAALKLLAGIALSRPRLLLFFLLAAVLFCVCRPLVVANTVGGWVFRHVQWHGGRSTDDESC